MEPLVVSASEAARLLATSPNVIQKQLESGELPAYRDGQNWKIPVELLKIKVNGRALEEAEERRKKCRNE